MKKIRINNDIDVSVSVYRDGAAEDFTGKTVSMFMQVGLIKYPVTDFTIPDGVTSIGQSAFNGCYSLSSITIPDGVTSIGQSAFNNCLSMKEYHMRPTTPPTMEATNVFANIPSDCIIYVPQGCLEAYQTATNWATYADYMQEEPN